MENTITIKSYKNHLLLEQLKKNMLDVNGNFTLEKLVPAQTIEKRLELWGIASFEAKFTQISISPSKIICTFHSNSGPISKWLEKVFPLFPGIDFTYEYAAIESLIAGIYLVRSNKLLLHDSYAQEDPKANKSVRGFINYLVHTLKKEEEAIEKNFSKELFHNKLNFSKIIFTYSISKQPSFSTVKFSSPYTNLIFTKDFPNDLFVDFDTDPYAILKKIITFLPRQFILLECFSNSEKSFTIREVASILTKFDLTGEGYSWESCREDFNMHAKLHGFKQNEKKNWLLHPLNFKGIFDMLTKSQNGQFLTNTFIEQELSATNKTLLIELATKCGYIYYEELFYLTINFDELY